MTSAPAQSMTAFGARHAICCLGALLAVLFAGCRPTKIIEVSPVDGDATELLQSAIDSAATIGPGVTIRLQPGTYNISRLHSTRRPYFISNTASREENPDPTKHIGLLMRHLQELSIDGNGATIMTHGEMTAIVIDSCSDITISNITLSAADPTVPEFRVDEVTDSSAIISIIAPSRGYVRDSVLYFEGIGWTLTDERHDSSKPHHAQVFYPDRNLTLRCESPLSSYSRALGLNDNRIELIYGWRPNVNEGEHYQVRHGLRTEVCALISDSRNVTIRDARFHFMGNFGLVGQFSENITYDNITCSPDPDGQRTNAGFADFVQMSGCRGLVRIINSHFEGSHDDPINIHGTHLAIAAIDGDQQLTVRYMHPQTFGFSPCHPGDTIEVVSRVTLLPLTTAVVNRVEQLTDYEYRITTITPLPAELVNNFTPDGYVIENISWTPSVEIRNNYFARTPTRAILLSTRRKTVIENNTFYRIPMPAILVADDANSWYESGPVHDLTISNNTFIDCGIPTIEIKPELTRYTGHGVHRNIAITDNRFSTGSPHFVISVTGTDGVTISGNIFKTMLGVKPIPDIQSLIDTTLVNNVTIDRNTVVSE